MSEPVGVTPEQLSSAEEVLRGQMPAAAELQAKANGEGLDMMAWGVPGLFISPGYYSVVSELQELFRMMHEGLEGHADRLKECREAWETADMDLASEFSEFDPEGLAESMTMSGSTWSSVVDDNAVSASSPAKLYTGFTGLGDKFAAVGRADDAGEMTAALSDLAASTAGWGWDMMDAATNPLSFLIGAGLDFLISLIQPIDDAVGMVTGNGERMMAEIERWEGIKGGLPPIGEAVAAIPEGGLSEWSGQDGDLAREKIKEFAESVFELGDKVQVLQGLMQLCELIATLIRKTLLSLLSDWITKQIIAWAAATAASTVTFGGAAATQMVNSIISATKTVINALSRYNQAAETFVQASKTLSNIHQVFKTAATPLAEAGFKTTGMVGTLASTGGPSSSDIADGFNG